MKTKRKEFFQNLKPRIDFKKLMDEVKKRGYVFYRPAKKPAKDEGEK